MGRKKAFDELQNSVQAKLLRKNYESWRLINFADDRGFFIIYETFKSKNILNQISGNALKLYIFFGISSNNETGESWYSLEYIAKYFGKSTRTISNWILELEKVKLIKRIQLERDGVAHTFLKPY